MPTTTFSPKERDEIRKLFGVPLEEMDTESFKKLHKELRAKYHPDNFEQFGNDAIKEMATEKFQLIESLSEKIGNYLGGNPLKSPVMQQSEKGDYFHPDALFAGKKIKIEILTADKDLKYHLFGTHYRWLEFGDSFKIPNTKASITIDEDHRGRRVGFQESIRMYLTFDENDSIEEIVAWLFGKIEGSINTLLVAGETVLVEVEAIEIAIKKETYLRIGFSDKTT
ncbi:MAG: J domain-containing protein [Saprospiraceae bacterium]